MKFAWADEDEVCWGQSFRPKIAKFGYRRYCVWRKKKLFIGQ